jgi:prophage regulatory protein
MPTDEPFLLNRKELKRYVPYSIQHIYRLVRSKDFPAPVRIGPRRVGWLSTEVFQWIRKKANSSRQCSSAMRAFGSGR